MGEQYQASARKYRPQTFREVIGQAAVVTTLRNAMRLDRISHAYLFVGSRGVGKTTLARLFAKALNCSTRQEGEEPCNQCPSCREITSGQSLDVIEIDGASNRGIDDIREINETVGYAPSHGLYKIYIIDEVHMLTKEAFNALLKTLEEPPPRAKFFLATTEPNKVLPTIISRCQRFDLGRILLSQIIEKLEAIAKDQKRDVAPEALHLIATFSDGSLRDAESLLDQILCFTEGIATEETVRKTLGLVAQELFFSLDQAFSEARVSYAFELVEELFKTGKDLAHFLEQLIEHFRLLSLCKTMGESALPASLRNRYAKSAHHYTQSQCLYLLEYLLEVEAKLQKSICPRVQLEAALLHVIRSRHRIPIEVLVRKLSEMEAKITQGVVDSPRTKEVEGKKELSIPPIPSSPPELPASPPPSQLPELSSQPPDPPSTPPPPLQPSSTGLCLKPVPFNPYQVTPPSPTPTLTPSAKHPSHYDTLIRFAAIELEGSVKL